MYHWSIYCTCNIFKIIKFIIIICTCNIFKIIKCKQFDIKRLLLFTRFICIHEYLKFIFREKKREMWGTDHLRPSAKVEYQELLQ